MKMLIFKCSITHQLKHDDKATSQAVLRQQPTKTKKPGMQGPRQKNELNRFTCSNVTRFSLVISVKENLAPSAFGEKMNSIQKPPQSFEDKLRQWLMSHDNMNGSKVLSYLMSHPNTKLHVSFLDRCTFTGRWPEPDEAALNGYEAQPLIPMVDKITIKQCRKRAETLIKEIQGAVELGDEKREAILQLEYKLLMKYIKQVTTPSHKIKNFEPSWKKAYQNVYACVWKSIRKMRSQDPELASWVNGRLKTGRCFVWKTHPVQPKTLHIHIDIASVDYNPGKTSNVM